jgi:hypothetical protein
LSDLVLAQRPISGECKFDSFSYQFDWKLFRRLMITFNYLPFFYWFLRVRFGIWMKKVKKKKISGAQIFLKCCIRIDLYESECCYNSWNIFGLETFESDYFTNKFLM